MSRCILDNEETGNEVVIGWDNGAKRFFAQAIRPNEDEPFYWVTPSAVDIDTLTKLVDEVALYSCKVDRKLLIDNLIEDCELKSERLYGIEDLNLLKIPYHHYEQSRYLIEKQHFHQPGYIDKRIILNSSKKELNCAIASLQDFPVRYTHVDLHFTDAYPEKSKVIDIAFEFKQMLLSAYKDDEIICYMEAHFPCLDRYLDKQGNEHLHCPHNHYLIPHLNLRSRRYIEQIIGDLDDKFESKYSTSDLINAFIDDIEDRYDQVITIDISKC